MGVEMVEFGVVERLMGRGEVMRFKEPSAARVGSGRRKRDIPKMSLRKWER
jgi:hypothetical protein